MVLNPRGLRANGGGFLTRNGLLSARENAYFGVVKYHE